MKNAKKILALLLALVMVLGMFTGCNKQVEETPEEPPKADAENQPAAPEQEDAPADPFAEEVELVWAFCDGKGITDGWDEVVAKVNEITKEKINATIKFEMIPLGEYTDKMNMKFTSGEYFDLCFTGAWNPYASAVAKGAYAELTPEMLETYCAESMANLNPVAWDAVTIDGKIYGFPIQQIYVRNSGLRVFPSVANAAGYDISKIQTLDDLDAYADAVLALNNPDYYPIALNGDGFFVNLQSYFGWDTLINVTTPGVVDYDDPTVYNQFASEEFKEYCYTVKRWANNGYIPADAVLGGESVAGLQEGVGNYAAWQPMYDILDIAAYGEQTVHIKIADAAMTTSAINATVNAVSANSKNIERTLAFINLLNTDKELYNTILYGIEGRDWNWVDESQELIEIVVDEAGNPLYKGNFNFLVADTFNAYYTDPAMVGQYELVRDLNNTSKGSCLLGFAFNAEPVSSQIANCSAIISEHLVPLVCGAVEDVDAAIADMQKALESAGVNEIIAEMQAQVDAWMAG